MWPAIGAAISGGMNLLGGILGREAQQEQQAHADAQYWNNFKAQQNQAAHAVKMRVDDAREAGIHPLYALGASVPTFSPVSSTTVTGNPMGAALSSAGQDISRAMNAMAPADVRAGAWNQTVQDLSVTNMSLKNELLRSQIAKINQAGGTPPPPPVKYTADEPAILPPEPTKQKQDEMPLGQFGGIRIRTAPDTSNVEDFFNKRYGDEGPVSWAASIGVAMRDMQYNLNSMKFLDILRAIDQGTQMKWLGSTLPAAPGRFFNPKNVWK